MASPGALNSDLCWAFLAQGVHSVILMVGKICIVLLHVEIEIKLAARSGGARM